MKNADFSKWTTTDKIADTIKDWADNKEYPVESFYRI